MAKTKFTRVAVEGATASDGRVIEKSWLQDIAATYNPQTYGARVNLEHIRGATGAAPFKALGDVLAVKAEPVQLTIGGKAETRLALYAQIDPTPDLVSLTKDRQKIYTSIEVAPNFGNTGKAGLVGLAVTDTPASLGTEALKFSTGEGAFAAELKSTLDGRKADKANLFSAAEETSIELEPDAPAGGDDRVSLKALFAGLGELFGHKASPAAASTAVPPTTPPAAAFDEAAFTRVTEGMATQFAAAIEAAVKPVRDDLAAFKAQVERTDAGGAQRPSSPGAAGFHAAVDY